MQQTEETPVRQMFSNMQVGDVLWFGIEKSDSIQSQAYKSGIVEHKKFRTRRSTKEGRIYVTRIS